MGTSDESGWIGTNRDGSGWIGMDRDESGDVRHTARAHARARAKLALGDCERPTATLSLRHRTPFAAQSSCTYLARARAHFARIVVCIPALHSSSGPYHCRIYHFLLSFVGPPRGRYYVLLPEDTVYINYVEQSIS